MKPNNRRRAPLQSDGRSAVEHLASSRAVAAAQTSIGPLASASDRRPRRAIRAPGRVAPQPHVSLHQFLAGTGGSTAIAIRSAMVAALADLGSRRQFEGTSYSSFYEGVLRRVSGAPMPTARRAPAPAASAQPLGPLALPPQESVSGLNQALNGYRQLGLRVVVRAFRDLLERPQSPEHDSARIFLMGTPMMRLWCEVARIDPLVVMARAQRLSSPRGQPFTRALQRSIAAIADIEDSR